MAGHPLGKGQLSHVKGGNTPSDAHRQSLGHIDTVLLQEEHRQLQQQHVRLAEEYRRVRHTAQELAIRLKDTATAATAVHVQATADIAGAKAAESSALSALRKAAKGKDEALWSWYEGQLDKANAEAEHLRRQNTQLSLQLAAVTASRADQSASTHTDSGQGEEKGGGDGAEEGPHGDHKGGVVTVPRATWLRTQRQLSSTLKRNTALEAAQHKRNKGDRVAAATHRRLHRVTAALARAQASALTALSAAETGQLEAAAATADRNATRSALLGAKAAAVLAGEQVALLQGEISGLRSYMSQAADSAIALKGFDKGVQGGSKDLQVALRQAQQGVPPTPKGVKGGYGMLHPPQQEDMPPPRQELVPWQPAARLAEHSGLHGGVTHGDPSLTMRAAFSALLHDAADTAPSLIPRLQALQSRVYSQGGAGQHVASGGAMPAAAQAAYTAAGPKTQELAHAARGGAGEGDAGGVGGSIVRTRTPPQSQWGPTWQGSLRQMGTHHDQ